MYGEQGEKTEGEGRGGKGGENEARASHFLHRGDGERGGRGSLFEEIGGRKERKGCTAIFLSLPTCGKRGKGGLCSSQKRGMIRETSERGEQ